MGNYSWRIENRHWAQNLGSFCSASRDLTGWRCIVCIGCLISAYLRHLHNFLDIMPGSADTGQMSAGPGAKSGNFSCNGYFDTLPTTAGGARPSSGELWSLMVWNKYVFIRCIIPPLFGPGLAVVFIALNAIDFHIFFENLKFLGISGISVSFLHKYPQRMIYLPTAGRAAGECMCNPKS